MRLTVNGESKDLDDVGNVKALVERLGLTAGRLAVELNGEIVPRADYAHRTLKDGDALEIVQMIGGG
jgi:sulfur carrier protein